MASYSDGAAIERYFQTQDPDIRRTIRDQTIYARIAVYAIEYNNFKRNILRDSNADTLAGDLIGLTLNGLGAVTGGAGTKAALAAAAAGVSGANAHINKDLYFDKTIPALIDQMDASQAAQLIVIKKNLGQDDKTYPLPIALVDAYSYRDAGSIPSAINVLTANAASAKSDTKSVQLNGDTSGTVAPPPAHRLVGFAVGPHQAPVPNAVIRNLP